MPRYQVAGTMTVNFDVEVEASSEGFAVSAVTEMSYTDLLNANTNLPGVEVDSVVKVKRAARK